MPSEKELYDELALYTLSHSDPSFIHQHVVDAFAAQNADKQSKPITVFFALVGLYLHLERNYTGKDIQREHVRLGRVKKPWPRFPYQQRMGSVTVADVIAVPRGKQRDEMIHAWCASVWDAWKKNNPQLVSQIVKELDAG